MEENCFLEQDSRKTGNVNIDRYVHKSGLPDPSVDHPLAPSGKNQTQHAAAPMQTIELAKIFVDY